MRRFRAIIGFSIGFVLLCNIFCGCQNTKGIVAKGVHYNVVNNGENYYLEFHKVNPNNQSFIGSVAAPIVYFDSVEEMKNDILTNNFTDSEIQEIRRFSDGKSELIQVFNLSKLFEPVYPSVFDDYTVRWSFRNYSFLLNSTQYAPYNSFHILTKADAENKIAEYNEFESREDISIQTKETDKNNRTIYDYVVLDTNYREQKVVYTLSTKTKTLYIEECYSQGLPEINRLHIIGNDDGLYFEVIISKYNELLTNNQLLEFGIREYVETSTS